jgi:OmcA/MtrC family decaheme c-type cytochrome
MTNCSVCHDSQAKLDVVNDMAVTGPNCLSCHGSMESWDFAGSGLAFHEVYTEATDCQECHRTGADAAAPELVTVADFHNGLATERAGVIWNGVDTSVVEGDKIDMQITGVSYNADKTQMSITWTAKYNAVSVNPCNTTPAAGAPAFHAIPAFGTTNRNNFSVLRSYAQGDDFSIGLGTSPGQPSSVTLSTTAGANGYTTCSGNVATTTLTVETPPAGATRAIVALQGKPWVLAVNPADADGVMQVRALTPTREFMVGTGAAPTALRRPIADTEQCVKCHVGSLYQHGGNRVDNVSMCVICHNSASSEQNVQVGMGVDKTDSYDGLNGQTYEFKTMLHAIHSSGHEGQKPIVIYRSNGIYAWAPDVSLLRNWKAGAACKTSPTLTENNGNIVFGSSPETCRVHNFHIPTYPRALNDCGACHKAGFDQVPDQDKAVATTLDAGAAPWPNQLDDVLQGSGAAGCTSCHQDSASKGHAYQNGWVPQTFENGRQTILDEANK